MDTASIAATQNVRGPAADTLTAHSVAEINKNVNRRKPAKGSQGEHKTDDEDTIGQTTDEMVEDDEIIDELTSTGDDGEEQHILDVRV
jgi:hypothetical protein